VIQSVENVNHQLLVENVFLRDEMGKAKGTIMKLIEESSALHTELKNTTVLEILNEFQNQAEQAINHSNKQFNATAENPSMQNQLKTKEYKPPFFL
jgi:phage shock protein A